MRLDVSQHIRLEQRLKLAPRLIQAMEILQLPMLALQERIDLELEKNPGDSELLNNIFRSAHTIKGSSRMLKLMAISEVAHKLEDVLGALRSRKIELTAKLSPLLFKGVDTIAAMIEKTDNSIELTDDNTPLCNALAEAAEGKIPDDVMSALGITGHQATEVREKEAEEVDEVQAKERKTGSTTAPVAQNETLRINADRLNDLIRIASEMTSAHSRAKQRLTELDAITKLSALAADLTTSGNNGGSSEDRQKAAEVVADMSLSLKKYYTTFRDDLAMEELMVKDLQERTLTLRMLPLSTVFDAFYRTVREMAQQFGKNIGLVIEGDETEMDKMIIEKIGAPLVHMIRNSIDHGIELPEERIKLGKPGKGTIRLSAGYEGGNVLIVISDDGNGIYNEKIKEKALKKGFCTEEELASMSESEIRKFIFQPGFSTSAIITDISGRGVGMDVVKKNIIEDMKGSIAIDTEEGKGTTFYIRLPMTLALMRVILVGISGMTFAFPDTYISEIIQVSDSDVIDVVDKRAINIREKLVPVEDLYALLGVPQKSGAGENEPLLLIARLGDERLAMVVDSIVSEEDMVIKSLPSHMKNIKLVSGVIITGSDEVVNVLNVPALFEAAKEIKGAVRRRGASVEKEREIHVLVVDDSINTREIEKSILEAYGYNVTLAGDGVEAFEKAKSFKYDIVITDVEMPNMDGFTLTEKLRMDEEYHDSPIILLTSRDKEEDKRRGIQVGANAYIVKGDFEQSNLLDTVKNLIE